MKIRKYTFAIFAVILLCMVAAGIARWYSSNKDVREINRLVAEFKSHGIPTSLEEIQRLPDTQNGWSELKPILVNDNKSERQEVFFEGGYGHLILKSIEPKKMASLTTYLMSYRFTTQRFADFRSHKPHFDAGTNIDKYADSITSYAFDACVSALEHASKHEASEADTDLNVALYLRNELVAANNTFALRSANSIGRCLLDTCARMVEFDPKNAEIVTAFMDKAEFTEASTPALLKYEFASNMAYLRDMDSTKLDKNSPPWPMSLFVAKNDPDVNAPAGRRYSSYTPTPHTGSALISTPLPPATQAPPPHRPGDFMPESRTVRKEMIQKFAQWFTLLPEITAADLHQLPDLGHLYPISLPTVGEDPARASIPRAFTRINVYELGGYEHDPNQFLEAVQQAKEFQWAIHLLDHLIREKRKSGQYPKAIDQSNEPTWLNGLIYRPTPTGFRIESKKKDPDGTPVFRLSIPVKATMNAQEIEVGHEAALSLPRNSWGE